MTGVTSTSVSFAPTSFRFIEVILQGSISPRHPGRTHSLCCPCPPSDHPSLDFFFYSVWSRSRPRGPWRISTPESGRAGIIRSSGHQVKHLVINNNFHGLLTMRSHSIYCQINASSGPSAHFHHHCCFSSGPFQPGLVVSWSIHIVPMSCRYIQVPGWYGLNLPPTP